MTKVSPWGSLNEDYPNFIAVSRYARWIEDEGRRETWAETVNRYATFMSNKLGDKIDDKTVVELHNAILDQEIMPSMRALMTAGEALERENIASYNCALVAVDNVRAFDEALYVLMNGTGLGFNVESAYVSKLPSMPPEFFDTETTIVVHDSKLGWAKAYKELIALLLQGQVPSWDLSRVRPAGAKLKTFGGRACLTGDTIVYKDRKKARGHNEITIADLYDLQNGEGKWKNKPNHFKQVKLRALSEKDGIFYRNNVLEVIDNGFAPVYEIVTENGYRIKATGNHRFMTSTGDYDFVDNFNVGDLIAVNGSKEKKTGVCIDCNTSVSRRSIRCRPCANQNQIGDTALLTTARQRKECRDYLGSACERCGVSETRLTVHHQDKNPYNNDWSNLETLCEPCHQVHHANERSFGDPYSHKYLSFDEIISIEYAGVERVFDLAMEAPDHNFVANGFVSHNSGPQPLIDLFDFTVESFKRASGRKLKPIEVHDIMCKIAEVVVVGGVRRSALISMSDLDDFDMSQAKSGKWWEHNGQRALSNNSAVYYDKPSVGQFFTEWSNLYESKSGERGIINMGGIRKHVASFERRDASKIVGKNPCVTADTWVTTSIGSRQVKDLIGTKFDVIVDSKPYRVLSDGFVYTGNKEVYLVTSTDGYSFKATADHKILTERGWVEVQDLDEDDRIVLSNNKEVHVGKYDPAGYAIGNLIGDGTFSDTTAYVAVWDEDGSGAVKNELANYMESLPHSGSYRGFFDTSNQQRAGHKSFTNMAAQYDIVRGNKVITDKIERASLEFQSGVLRGYFDADGHVEGVSTGGGVSIRLSSVSMNNMVRVQRMLQRFGIKSAIRDLFPEGRESFGGYKSKRSYRLVITGSDTARFMDVIGFSNTAKHDKYYASVGRFYNKPHVTGVRSVEYIGFEDVYDVTVDRVHRFDANGVIVHNCAEINLRSSQFCVTPDTPLITEDGIVNIGDVQDKPVKVWNGNRWSSVTVRKTRENSELVRVTFSDGSYLDCTPDHRFSVKNRFESEWRTVQAKDLTGEKHSLQVQPTVIDRDNGVRVDDAYTIGFAVGDGCVYNGKVLIDLYGDKKIKCPVSGSRGGRTRKHGCSVDSVRVTSKVDAELVSKLKVGSIRDLHTWNKESVLEFFAGMADADGSATGTGGIRIYISDETRARDAQLVLTGVGIKSSVNLVQMAGAVTNKGVRKKDLWYLQITDASMLPTHRLDVSGGHDAKFRGKYQNIKSVEKLDYTSDVFCFNEPENHMAVFGNVLTFQCNLTEVVIDPTDTLDAIRHKVKMATILGTYQATLTDFKYVRPVWKKNTEEERLLGVSLTGIYGHKFMSGQETHNGITLPEFLRELYDLTAQVNAEWSEKFGIPASTALTTVKPSGTVSQLVGASSGIHPWYAPYYVRTVRGDNKDPLTQFLKAQGVPNEPDVTKPDDTTVFSFPVKAPSGVITSRDLSAIDHLKLYCVYRENWTDHDVSVTINVREEEWPSVGAWVYDNFDRVGGVSFLPFSDHTYKQAPYQAISEDEYNVALSNMPTRIDWVDLPLYELEDSTAGNQTLACSGSSCEIVDITK